MTSLSSLSKGAIGASITLAVIFPTAVYEVYRAEYLIAGCLGISIFLLIYTLFMLRKAGYGINKAVLVMNHVADGNLKERVLHVKGEGNIGSLLIGLNQLLDRTESFTREANAALEYAARGEYFRHITPEGQVGDFLAYSKSVNSGLQAMDDTTRDFTSNATAMGSRIRSIISGMSSAAIQLETSANSMADIASETQKLSTEVSGATNEASQNVSSVAAATEEFSVGISSVADQVKHSAEKAQSAVEQVSQTDDTINRLSEAALRIGEVVQLINDIAEQTNLLALNATIEAARAGEAGKGFAVVANEVKSLATQTGRATEEIVAQINNMQFASNDAVDAIKAIGGIIRQIHEASGVISGVVEEQNGAVHEINGSISVTVQDMEMVTGHIGNVAQGATDTSTAIVQVKGAARELAKQASTLQNDVDKFINHVTA